MRTMIVSVSVAFFVALALPLRMTKSQASNTEKDDAGKAESAPESPKVAAKLVKYKENRTFEAQREDGNRFHNTDDNKAEAAIQLSLPKEFGTPQKWKPVVMVKALADGTQEVKAAKSWSDDWLEFDKFGLDGEAELKGNELIVPVRLELPPRSAKSLNLSASVELLFTGEVKTKTIEEITAKKKGDVLISIPPHLTITVSEVTTKEVSIKIDGAEEYINDIRLLTGEGEKYSVSTMTTRGGWGFGGKENSDVIKTYEISTFLNDDAPKEFAKDTKMEIVYTEEVKKKSQSFEVKDIVLP